MKSRTIVIALTFCVLFSSSSYAGWTKVGKNATGDTFYVDFERIRKVDGYVYWWELWDYPKLNPVGHLSRKVYQQGDCKLFRVNQLSRSFHRQPMDGGKDNVKGPIRKGENWIYPTPNSVDETILQSVCNWQV
jgi:hypothetical protein